VNELSLFTGYGGLTLGLRLAGVECRTVGYCEIDPYCQAIIRARIQDGFLDDAPIWSDIRTLDGSLMAGVVDIVTGGFPCQPHSTAGRRRGADDPRDLWPDTLRVIGEVGPRFVLLENVTGLVFGRRPYVSTVLGGLAGIGYDAEWGLVPAAAVGAQHLRWRWWCLAYPAGGRCGTERRAAEQTSEHPALERIQQPGADGEGRMVADANRGDGHRRCLSDQMGRERSAESPSSDRLGSRTQWSPEPTVGRVAYGVAHRVDRLRALGNGVVPAVAARFLQLLGLHATAAAPRGHGALPPGCPAPGRVEGA